MRGQHPGASDARVELIGVRFDGSGREHGQADAAPVLRAAGLLSAMPGARATEDVVAMQSSATRGSSGLLNEQALFVMVDAVHQRVGAVLRRDRFPVVYGADCAVLLGAVPALRDTATTAGLLFFDAHEDATPMARSATGEAANMEIAMLAGLAGSAVPSPWRRRLPALSPDAIVMLGQRDHKFRRKLGVPSIADIVYQGVSRALPQQLPATSADAARYLTGRATGWWLHIDLDVLRGEDFVACDSATDPDMPGGLTWPQLNTAARSALDAGGCRGLSVGVYNTDLDPDRRAARQIVQFLHSCAASLDHT